MYSSQSTYTKLSAPSKSARDAARRHIAHLQALEKRRDDILRQVSHYLSAQKAEYVKSLIKTMQYTPVRYDA